VPADFRIEGIGQIHISSDDLPRSIAFYRDILGLTFLFEVPGQPMAFFDCGGVRLYIGKPEREEFRSRPLLYLRVANIRQAYDVLKGRGVAFMQEPHVVHRTESSELWMAGFKDPDGTNLVLMSDVPVPASART
jgi:catechol 2,3-dioxygenase-like lactoylglutathione lyase family enzyme